MLTSPRRSHGATPGAGGRAERDSVLAGNPPTNCLLAAVASQASGQNRSMVHHPVSPRTLDSAGITSSKSTLPWPSGICTVVRSMPVGHVSYGSASSQAASRQRHRDDAPLVSDGHANQGETDPGRLEHVSSGARSHGVTISTVGIAWTTTTPCSRQSRTAASETTSSPGTATRPASRWPGRSPAFSPRRCTRRP